MWLSPSSLLAAQIPLQAAMSPFAFKEGPDVFSPKDLVELGRPGTGASNPAGDLALVAFSKYSLADKKNNKSIFITPLESNVKPLEVPLVNGGEAFWLDDRTVAHAVTSEDKKHLDLYAISVEFHAEQSSLTSLTPKLVGTFPTSTATNFKFHLKAQILVFSDQVYEDGDIRKVNEHDEEYENRGNTAYVYDSRWVDYDRHWDHWILPKKASLFSVTLCQDPDLIWHLEDNYVNLLHGTGHYSPVEPFGGTDDFDVSTTHVVYTTKDPKIHFAWHTKQDVFIVDLKGANRKELTSGQQGATHSPVFSPWGDKVAWLELDKDGYESDRAKIVIYDLKKDVRFTVTQDWDRSPDGLAFSKDGKVLYFTAGDEAKVKVFAIAVPETPPSSTTHPKFSKPVKPVALTHTAAASGLQTLFNHRILFSVSSYTSPNDLFIIRHLADFESELLSSHDSKVEFKGQVHQITRFTEETLKPKKLSVGEELWFDGVDQKVQGWVLKPRGWEEGKKKAYPVVMLIHGGPQGAWEDQWSNRWNPNVFAGQGYFVIAFNPTGSTTFGQRFTDAIAGDWGGKPFQDLINGWEAAKEKYPEIDFDRAVAAGASWGGYAINWIQGHPEYGFGFKALVCHDGVFDSNYNGFSTDELFFFNHDWKGRPWDSQAKKLSEKFSPSNYVSKWSTPQLLIHGSKDYRLPETESLGAFHALQQQGVPSRLVVFPDENHWVLNHGNSLKWHYEVFRWFDEFLNKKD